MKHILLFVTACFSMTLVSAQTRRINGTTGVAATTATVNISKEVDRVRRSSGDVLVYTEKGKFQLYANFSNNKVSAYYAINGNGKKINATYYAMAVSCKVCIFDPATSKQVCYEVDCSKVPPPKATENSRQ